ncbi:MAG: hypothetical protein Tp152DCM223801_16 [Prokaryotic dsDNA virus sp.]|nr:MAG: hypothetical protein Tp152DCM223801_16 [Prokaryotic dsDNA virus sp.]|tara:strand:- start:15874 stop:16299 length:426 start_codon:yes stop_codon:yes gene_type:complete
MRETYENKNSLEKENAFSQKIEGFWGCKLQKMHKHHIIDYMVVNNKAAVAWLEVKCLNRTYKQYPHFILSYSKYMKGVEYYRTSRLPFLFAVRLYDGDYYYRYDKTDNYKIIWGGRTKNTRDEFDVEPIIQIPITEFKEIK